MPDDHSKLVPPLPIPNRTVKRLSADDSAATSVKVGHRQAVIPENPRRLKASGVFALGAEFLLQLACARMGGCQIFRHAQQLQWPGFEVPAGIDVPLGPYDRLSLASHHGSKNQAGCPCNYHCQAAPEHYTGCAADHVGAAGFGSHSAQNGKEQKSADGDS